MTTDTGTDFRLNHTSRQNKTINYANASVGSNEYSKFLPTVENVIMSINWATPLIHISDYQIITYPKIRSVPKMIAPMESLFTTKYFEFRDKPAVELFLQNNLDLVGILNEGLTPIHRIFGQNTKIALMLHEHYDTFEFGHLIAKIQVHDDVDDAIAKLDKFGNDWYLRKIKQLKNRLSFNLEFV